MIVAGTMDKMICQNPEVTASSWLSEHRSRRILKSSCSSFSRPGSHFAEVQVYCKVTSWLCCKGSSALLGDPIRFWG